nr:hypothetical protein [Mycobacteroides salmoniphilum]
MAIKSGANIEVVQKPLGHTQVGSLDLRQLRASLPGRSGRRCDRLRHRFADLLRTNRPLNDLRPPREGA